jgi:hypothetical protein
MHLPCNLPCQSLAAVQDDGFLVPWRPLSLHLCLLSRLFFVLTDQEASCSTMHIHPFPAQVPYTVHVEELEAPLLGEYDHGVRQGWHPDYASWQACHFLGFFTGGTTFIAGERLDGVLWNVSRWQGLSKRLAFHLEGGKCHRGHCLRKPLFITSQSLPRLLVKVGLRCGAALELVIAT